MRNKTFSLRSYKKLIYSESFVPRFWYASSIPVTGHFFAVVRCYSGLSIETRSKYKLFSILCSVSKHRTYYLLIYFMILSISMPTSLSKKFSRLFRTRRTLQRIKNQSFLIHLGSTNWCLSYSIKYKYTQ